MGPCAPRRWRSCERSSASSEPSLGRDPLERSAANRYHRLAMSTLLGLVQVFLCVVLIFLILMHSGKDSGLSGAFGVGTGAGPFGGGSLVERNLNRWTVGFAIAFVINTIVLIKIS